MLLNSGIEGNKHDFGTLRSTAAGSNLDINANGNLYFQTLSGTADMAISKRTGNIADTSLSFDLLQDYNGTITITNNNTSALNIFLGSANQAGGNSATISYANTIQSDEFTMRGAGSLTLTGGLQAATSFDQQGGELNLGSLATHVFTHANGTLNVAGDVTTDIFEKDGTGTVHIGGSLTVQEEFKMYRSAGLTLNGELHLGEGVLLRYTQSAGATDFGVEFGSSLTAEDKVYINSFDFTAEERENGVNLGLRWRQDSQDDFIFTEDMIIANGYNKGSFSLLQGEDGFWYFMADKAPGEDVSQPGIWDANWVYEDGGSSKWVKEYMDRPADAAAPPLYRGSSNEVRLATERDHATMTSSAKPAVWAQLDQYSTSRGADVIGGDANTYAGTVENELWLDVVGGAYGTIVGGNDASQWSGGGKLDYKGSVHIQLRKVSDVGPSVFNVIGGMLRDGHGSAFDATRDDGSVGGSFISIGAGVEVKGFVLGGSFGAHNSGATTFIGNSHIYIYDALAANSEANPLDSNPDKSPQAIIGGNMFYRNLTKTTFKGDSFIYIDLIDKTANVFGKQVVGGDYVSANSNDRNSNDNSVMVHNGSAEVIITRANGVVFEADVAGGSYMATQSASTITGDSSLRVDSGIYKGIVAGGTITHGLLIGTSFGTTLENLQAGHTLIQGNATLEAQGGEFYGVAVDSQWDDEHKDAIGSVALVAGIYLDNRYVPADTAAAPAGVMNVGGKSTLTVQNAQVHGHVVGASAAVGMQTKINSFEVAGGSHVSLKNIAVDADAKVVGGFLLAMPADEAENDARFSLGGVKLSIGGVSEVGDVIGGSWTHGLDVDGATLNQGPISLSLGGSTTVRGDVFAAGIQGGSTALATEKVSVSIGSGVHFEKANGAPTIISAGYLSTKEGLADNAFASYYDDGGNASTVAGERKLHLADSADYGSNLANAWLVGFEDILLKKDTKATVGAIFNDEELVNISGSGADKGEASQITMYGELINVLDAEGNKQSRVNNSALHLSNGVTLHVLASRSGKNTSYLSGVAAEGSSNMIIDFAQASGNDTLLVGTDISLDGGALTLNFNATEAMLTRALIQRQPQDIARYDAGNGSVLKMQGTTLTINVQAVESSLLTGKEVRLLIADGIEASEVKYVLNEDTLANLEKWFDSTPTVEVDGDLLLLGGKTVSPSTAVYHQKRTLTENGRAGAAMLDNLYTTLNPEWSDAGGDRTRLLNELERKFARNEIQEADTAMAAAAGASMAMLGQALAEDVDRQLRAIRNRTTTMGLNSDYNYDDLPRLQFWVNAEIDSRKMQSQDTAAGYRINSWGGTVGVAADLSATSTVGLALTAMYGDIETYSPDKLKGDMVTSYLSGFWRTASGAWNHTLVATVGLASVDAQRTVDYGSGSYSTESSPTGYAVGLMYEIGYSIPLNAEASAVIQPVANVSFRHSEIRGFSESGSDAGLEVEGMKHNTLILAGGVRAQALVGSEFFNSASILEGRVMLKGYSGDKSSSAQTAFQGASYKGTVKGREMGSIGVEIGAGLTLPVGEDQIFADFSAELRSAETNFNAAIGYKVDF